MEKDLDPEVIKSTQLSLGKYVKRPPLSEKLLKKPPFRFLHDVITTVLKTTGFFENLFEEEELSSENVKDRDSKILFLTKVIFVISTTTGKSLSVKPSKIVAGQEADKTNELLQCLAQALDDKLTSEKAVKQYKSSINNSQKNENKTKEPSKPVKKPNDIKKSSSKNNADKVSSQKDVSRLTTKQEKEKSNDVKLKKKENGSNKGEVKSTQNTKSHTKKTVKESPKEDNIQARPQNVSSDSVDRDSISKTTENMNNTLHSQDSEVSLDNNEDSFIKGNMIDVETHTTDGENTEKNNTSFPSNPNDLNSSSSSTDLLDPLNKTENNWDNIETSSIRVKSPPVIPSQAKYEKSDSPPKSLEPVENISEKSKPNSALTSENNTINTEKYVNSNDITASFNNVNDTKISTVIPNIRPLSVRPSSSRPGAPRMREKVDNVVKDTDNLLLGKVNIIVENTHNEEEEDTSLIIMDPTDSNADLQDSKDLKVSSNEHGHLVQQILDSQKELSQISGKTEIEWQFGAQKAREAMNQDTEQLRFNIQAMSRIANPLGKLMDHIQEDVEVMRQELLQWTNIYNDVNKEMLKQKTINEESLMSFRTKSKQLDNDIEEKHDKINDLKILIHKNAIRIEKLLNSSNVQ